MKILHGGDVAIVGIVVGLFGKLQSWCFEGYSKVRILSEKYMKR